MKCSAKNCLDDYIGESVKLAIDRVKHHGERDTKSHVLEYSIENEHVQVIQKGFKTISTHSENNRLKKKIAEALVKQERPSFNAQVQPFKLKLLN